MANYKDFAVSLVATAPSPATSGTSLTVTTGEGTYFPAPPFFATLAPVGFLTNPASAEKVLVTARSGDTFTIVRAQTPTTAKTVATGWVFSNSLYTDDLGSSSIVMNEAPTGLVNGSNTVYTTAAAFTYITVYKNGVRMRPGAGNDYTVTANNQITFATAPATGSLVLVDYITGSTVTINGSNSQIEETPSGNINSSNTAFTSSRPYVGGSLEVYVNGIKQAPGTHFTEATPSTGSFTMSDAPATGDNMIIRYQYTTGVSGNADTVDGFNASPTATANNLYPLGADARFPSDVMPTQEAWQAVPYAAGWGDYDTSTFGGGFYMKDSFGFVHMRGLIKNISGATKAANAVMCTLPVGYRPGKALLYPVVAGPGIVRMDIGTSGAMYVSSSIINNDWVSMAPVVYKAEA